MSENYNETEDLKKINWALENTIAHWWNSNPILTYLGNSYIIVTAEIERFTLKVARLINNTIIDKNLKEEWGTFIKEESAHSYVHTQVSMDLKRFKYPIPFMTKFSKSFFRIILKRNIKTKMAFVLAMEFYAHELAQLALEGNFFPKDEKAIYDFLRWHAQEELSHCKLCFEIYKSIGGNYFRRVASLLSFTFFIGIICILFIPIFFFVDLFQGRRMKLNHIGFIFRFGYGHKGLIWNFIKNYLSFFNLRFNENAVGK